MENRESLERQLADLEARKEALFESGNGDQVAISRLNEQIAEVRQQLSSLEASEEAIVEITEGIASGLEMFEVGGTTFTLYDLAEDSDAADILRNGIKSISEKQATKFLNELNTQKSVYESQLSNKQELINSLIADRDELQSTNAQLQLEKDDAEEKRDAAAAQLLELQAEVARLNSHVDDLRRDIATGSANAHNIIDITSDAELEAAAQRLKAKKEQAAAEKKAAEEAARIKIYNLTQLDGTGSRFGANRADNDEYVTFGWLEKGKYVELSNEEVQRFREEIEAAKQAELESIPENDEPVEAVDDFRDIAPPELPDAHSDSGVGGNELVSEGDKNMDGRETPREEWESWVERVISDLGNRMTAIDYQANEMPPFRKAS